MVSFLNGGTPESRYWFPLEIHSKPAISEIVGRAQQARRELVKAVDEMRQLQENVASLAKRMKTPANPDREKRKKEKDEAEMQLADAQSRKEECVERYDVRRQLVHRVIEFLRKDIAGSVYFEVDVGNGMKVPVDVLRFGRLEKGQN